MKGVLLTLIFLAVADGRQSCYKCASPHLSTHWGKYMPLLAESERSPDDNCDDNPRKTPHSDCEGPCMSINVTGEYKGKPAFFGTLRECYSHFHRSQKILQSDRECTIRQVEIRRKTYTAEYCYCNGHLCNGEPQTLFGLNLDSNPSRRSYNRRYRNSAESWLFSYPLISVLGFCYFIKYAS
ncbi:hypothetical protein FO519_003828 [Halicephalobus sp. NKZ332]|nr:hypothetical protein FO519_003828 [Halicephalobus sp. NKZ332]